MNDAQINECIAIVGDLADYTADEIKIITASPAGSPVRTQWVNNDACLTTVLARFRKAAAKTPRPAVAA